MTMDKQPTTSRPAVTPYKRAKKPIVSAAEREKNRKSLTSYFVNGGDDAS